MASNIRVTLEIDNRKYLADLKSADSATKDFARNAQTNLSASERGFATVGRGIDALHGRLINLRTAILAVGFGALTRQALEFASTIKDLSDSTGYAVEGLLNLSNALATSGVSAEKMPELISRFSQSLEEAASSAGKTLYNFEQLGVSLQDIGQLSTQEALVKTLEGLARMGPGVERTARMMELFGKAGRTMDPEGVLASLRNAGGSANQYADNVRRAAELSDQLALAQQKLSVILLNVFGPAITKLNEFVTRLNESEEALQTFTDTLKTVGAVMAGVFAGGALLTFVRIIGTIGRGITAAGVAMGVFGDTVRGLFAPMGKILVIGRAIALIAGVGFGIYTASQLFDDFASRAVNALARVVEQVGVLAGAIGGGAFGAGVGSAFGPIGSILGGIAGSIAGGAAMDQLVERARRAREEAEAAARATRQATNPQAGALDRTLPEPDLAGAGGAGGRPQGPDTAGAQREIAQRIQGYRRIAEAFAEQNQRIRERIQLDTVLVGQDKAYAEVLQAQDELSQRATEQIAQLTRQKEELSQQDQRYAAVIDEQIARIRQLNATEGDLLRIAIQTRQAREAADRMALQTGRGVNELESIRAQLLGYSLTAIERFNQAQRAGDFRDKTQEEIAQLREQAQQQDALTTSLTTLNTQRATGSRLMEIETTIMGRQFTELEKLEALKAQNPEAFARKTQAEITALQQQAAAIDDATKRFQALAFARDLSRQGEDFVNSIRDQLRLDTALGESARRRIQVEIDGRNQLLQKIREINDRYGDEAQLSDEMRSRRRQELDEATNGINNLIAAKRRDVEADQARRETFEFGWDQAFRKYAEDAGNAAKQAETYFNTFSRGFEDAIVRFVQTGKLSFKDLANSIIADFARIQARRMLMGAFGMGGGGTEGGFSFGTLLSGIGKIFGFANGGNPAIGKPIIVGEAGPELMIPRNASTIIPNNALGGGGGIQQVSYTINATDAASFKQLVARDPQFIHSVVEQGRRGMPQRSRR